MQISTAYRSETAPWQQEYCKFYNVSLLYTYYENKDGEHRLKITLQQITDGQEEIIIRYLEHNEEIEDIIKCLSRRRNKICVEGSNGIQLISPDDILYLESVDGNVYAYTKSLAAKTNLTLAAAEGAYSDDGFFRCSKSMVLNIFHIEYLKSISGNRVDVIMDNGEHVIISRRYVKTLRSILKGEQL